MNFDFLKAAIEFDNDYKYIKDLYQKFYVINCFKNSIIFFDKSDENVHKNIEIVLLTIRKFGYSVSDCSDYDELYSILVSTIQSINNELLMFFQKKTYDKMIEESIKRMFY